MFKIEVKNKRYNEKMLDVVFNNGVAYTDNPNTAKWFANLFKAVVLEVEDTKTQETIEEPVKTENKKPYDINEYLDNAGNVDKALKYIKKITDREILKEILRTEVATNNRITVKRELEERLK